MTIAMNKKILIITFLTLISISGVVTAYNGYINPIKPVLFNPFPVINDTFHKVNGTVNKIHNDIDDMERIVDGVPGIDSLPDNNLNISDDSSSDGGKSPVPIQLNMFYGYLLIIIVILGIITLLISFILSRKMGKKNEEENNVK
jgi:hypothetical protein